MSLRWVLRGPYDKLLCNNALASELNHPCDGSNFGKVRTLKMVAGEAFQEACRGLGV